MPIFNVDVTADPHRPRVVGPDHAPVASINDFLTYLEQCARSPYTVRAYARGLAHFAGCQAPSLRSSSCRIRNAKYDAKTLRR